MSVHASEPGERADGSPDWEGEMSVGLEDPIPRLVPPERDTGLERLPTEEGEAPPEEAREMPGGDIPSGASASDSASSSSTPSSPEAGRFPGSLANNRSTRSSSRSEERRVGK